MAQKDNWHENNNPAMSLDNPVEVKWFLETFSVLGYNLKQAFHFQCSDFFYEAHKTLSLNAVC